MTALYSATEYREAVTKYLTQRDVMRFQQEQARQSGEKQRAERYQLGIDAMQAAADRHMALADEAAEREGRL